MPDFPEVTGEPAETKAKVLIAGVGNVLLGDDGFGVEVANRLMKLADLPVWVDVIETGIGGMSLVQELMRGYEALIIIDAYARGGVPGQLYFLEPVLPDLSDLAPSQLRDYFADTHYATPIRALSLLAQITEPPGTLRILGCEPAELDDMKIGLSPAVEIAVGKAVDMVTDLLTHYSRAGLGNIAVHDITYEQQQWCPGVEKK